MGASPPCDEQIHRTVILSDCYLLSSLTGREAAAAQVAWCGIDAAEPEGCGQRPGVRVEVAQDRYGVSDVDCTVIVGVGGIEAVWSGATGEHVAQGEDRIADVERAVGIRVPPPEEEEAERCLQVLDHAEDGTRLDVGAGLIAVGLSRN